MKVSDVPVDVPVKGEVIIVNDDDPDDVLEREHHDALLEAITMLSDYEDEVVSEDLVLRATELLQRLVKAVIPKGHFAVPNGQIAVDPQKVALIFTDGAGMLVTLDQQQPVGLNLMPRQKALASGLVELAWEGLVLPKRVIAGTSECGVICSFNANNRCTLPPHPAGTQHSGPQGLWF